MLKFFYSLLVLCISGSAMAQGGAAIAPQTDQRIQEVYGDQFGTLVQQNNGRHRLLADMIQERAQFVLEKPAADEKFPRISSLELFNKYNPGLQRDALGKDFNQETFNVLKYKIPLTSANTLVYRIDDTDYLLVIQPQTIRKL